MTAGGGALVWCPFPDVAAAKAAITLLLDDRLIACGNILPGVHSLFAFGGERGEADECGVLLKTTAPCLAAAMARLEAIHPYETPAIMAWPVTSTRAGVDWLDSETRYGCE